MRAVAVTALGGPEVLQVVDRPEPVPTAGQVLVRVRAACVNPFARSHVARAGPQPPRGAPSGGRVVAWAAGTAMAAVHSTSATP